MIERAAAFARRAHEGQRRKYTDEPYDIHLSAVAGLVRSVGGDVESIAAAWLHDVVEDTATTLDDVRREFGPDVGALVDELTDVSHPEDGNRAVRKALDREHLARASVRGQTIKLADLIDNARSISEHDPRFARTFLAEMEALLDGLGKGEPQLYALAQATLRECRARLPTAEPGTD